MILGVSSLKFSVFHSQRDLHYGVDLLAFFADSCEGVFIVSPEFAEREREREPTSFSLACSGKPTCLYFEIEVFSPFGWFFLDLLRSA
mmetsp:Transcript_51987/g.82556  ORF Transcript_51987/g.82556 Transcript_51987/m.82556 type:complete len:88 (-) Transcript_51987:98-361(-)